MSLVVYDGDTIGDNHGWSTAFNSLTLSTILPHVKAISHNVVGVSVELASPRMVRIGQFVSFAVLRHLCQLLLFATPPSITPGAAHAIW
jgi:hypothetical protein